MAKTKEKPLQDVNPPASSPSGAGNRVSIQTLKQFDKLRTQLVIELDRATINNLVKSYARGQAVATWESSQGKEKVELGGPDPSEQVKYLLEAMKPIHEYNDKLATILTKRLTDQINSGTAPGVMAKGMQETITHFMKAPVEVPLKGPDGKPKLDKDGNQVVRVYSPEAYANLLSRTLTYSLRNRGYLDHYKKMGSYDGWTSICSDDERSCEPCIDKDGQFFSWDSPQEPPAYHPFCRCRPKAHLSKDTEEGLQQPDDKPSATPTDLTGKMDFTLDPMSNYDEMVREVKKVFPFRHKKLSGAYGHFVPNPRGDIKATEIAVKSNLKGSPHAKSTLVHETGHGIDWMNSAKHDCARTVADLRDNCFPNLTLQEVQDIMDSELKDTMCQVRHAVAMNDVRLANNAAQAALLEDVNSPAALERLKKAPARVDYIKLRSDLLVEVEQSMKSKRYTEAGRPIETLGQFKNVMDREALKYSDILMEGAKSAQDLDEFVARKVSFIREFLMSRDSDATTLYRSSWEVPVTLYNFDDWAQQFFIKPIDPVLKKDIINYVKLSWMQKCEGHCWSTNYAWSKRPTERWAVFVQSLYIDPKRTEEIAPKAYKAFMENMRADKYASVLGRLLGFRAVM